MSQAGILVGTLYLLFALGYGTIYISSLVAIIRTKELISMPCYKLMLAIGVCDIGQISILGIIAGINAILESEMNELVNKTFGAILMACWYSSLVVAAILAANRVLTVWSSKLASQMFGTKKLIIALLLVMLYGLGQLSYYLWPNVDMMYFNEGYAWYYSNSTGSVAAATVNITNDSIIVGIMVVCYVIVGILLKGKRKITSSHKLTLHERRALLCSFLIAISIAVLDIFFFVAPTISDSMWVSFTANLLWLITTGNNGLFYVLFNKTIRNSLFKVVDGFTVPVRISRVGSVVSGLTESVF